VVLSKPNREKIKVIAAKAPASEMNSRRDALEDLAILTGGRAFMKEAGESANSVKITDLGQARRGWADPHFFGIVGGKGDPRRLREHIANLRAAYTNLDDPADRKRILQRLGKLMGGSAVLWVGASSPIEIEARKALAEKTAEAMRGAIREGVLPGGGVSLLSCRAALARKMHLAEDLDEKAAYNILYKAFQAPFCTIIQNAGADPGVVMSQMAELGSGYGYDVIRRQVTDISEAGIYDAASVTKEVVFSAIHSAALALTIDVLIHRKNPPDSYHTT
jgi:chaperonin GroEL